MGFLWLILCFAFGALARHVEHFQIENQIQNRFWIENRFQIRFKNQIQNHFQRKSKKSAI